MDTVGTDAQAESSTATADPEITETAPDGAQSDGDTNSSVPFSEHPRWKEVYGELKEAKAQLAYYQQLEAEAKAAAATVAPTEEEREQDAARQEAMATLERLVPGIQKLPEIIKALETKERESQAARVERAYEELGEIMKGAGLPTETGPVTKMAEQLNPILRDDPALMRLFESDPPAAVRKAWKRFVETVVTPLARGERAATQTKGASLSALPRAGQPGGGGSPTTKSGEIPRTIDDLFRQHKGALTG